MPRLIGLGGRSGRLGDGDPDLGVPFAFGMAGFAAEPSGVFEYGGRAVGLAAFLVAAVLFPNQLCARG